MATSKNAHARFPDVTGLRTSGPDFSRVGPHCRYLRVQESLRIDARAASSFAADDLGLAILSAWCVILFHYGSHEASNVQVPYTSQGGVETLVELDFAEQRELSDFTPTQLSRAVHAAKQQQQRFSGSDHGYAAFYEPAQGETQSSHFEELRLDARPELTVALSYHVRDVDHLVLEMKAAPAVHTDQSARLQLRQVAALLSSYHDDRDQHALSLERFDWKLRASDNPDYVHLPDPDHLKGCDADRLETEFEHFAHTTPDALALDFRFDLNDTKSTKWTYAEMNERAEKVKQLLWSYGVGSASSNLDCDHIVALYLEKSPETYLSFIGVLKAGAAWCPIDTDWPASRRQALLAKSNAKVVLTHDDKVSEQLEQDLQSDDVKSKGGMKAIRLDQLDTELEKVKVVTATDGARSILQLAYMIWTSGTTGLPKGVGIQHLAIIQVMRALRLYIPYGKDKIGTDQIRYLQYSAYNFDLSIMDCFYTWGLGGTICSCPRGVLLQDLVEVGKSIQPTHTLLTPAVMAMTERHRVPSLKVVISGGEKLSQVVADEWSKDCCLLNLYGPAEATLIAMNRRVPFGDRVKAPNIGVALPTVSCHALDKLDHVVIKGAVGELVLGGPQLARGYVGDPNKTADKFFLHPQLGRVYRTGDLVRQLDSQEFEYLGRIDDQVKINGIRIELLEINAAIKNSHSKIKDSDTMAFPKKDNESEQQIINFSALPGGQPGELLRLDEEAIAVARELQSKARENLPSYMVPHLFVILSHFPRTSSAKIDRIALKNVLSTFDQLDWENKLANEGDDDDTDPATAEAEACLRKWLAKLCSVDPDKIGRKTPFTSVGLDSIRAMTFSQRVTQEGYAVSVLDIARFPSLKALCRHLQSSESSSQERNKRASKFLADWDAAFRPAVSSWLQQRQSAVKVEDIQSVLPCTPLQEGMLAESQRDPSSYRIQRMYQLPSDCDEERLRQALSRTVEHFDSLRTSFADVGSLEVTPETREWPFQAHFLQVVWKFASPEIRPLRIEAGADAEHIILSTARSQLRLDPFGSAPPVAFLLVEQETEKALVVVAHHSTYDARSLGIFEDYVEAYYRGTSPPPAQQFSAALAHILPINDKEVQQRADIWAKALSSYPKGEFVRFPTLSLTKPSEEEVLEASAHKSKYINASVSWAQIESFCRNLGVSARAVVQTAWALVLSEYIESQHLILGDSVSGRALSAELDQVYGPVLATIPVPFLLRIEQRLSDLIKETDAFHKSVIEAQHTDLGSIRRLLQVPPGEPLFHSVFVLEPAPSQADEVTSSHFRLAKRADLGVATEHVLGVEVLPGSDGSVKLGLSWQKIVINEGFGNLMLDQFNRSLLALCTFSDDPVESFLPDSSRVDHDASSLYSITKSQTQTQCQQASFVGVADSLDREAISDDRCAVEVYQELPRSTSTRQPTATISYAELERASKGVASLFSNLPRNSVIGVCLERSIESYVVPLAILKAGHVYLPLDPTLPTERKKELLKDSGAAVLIASGQDTDFDALTNLKKLDVNSSQFQHASKANDAVRFAEVWPDDVAFIIYTSGSTGKPKGCLLTQANLAAAIEGFRTAYEKEAPGSFESSARFLARSAEAFDVHLLEIFLSLRVGATIVTGPRAIIHEDLANTIFMLEVTHACVVPSLFFSKGERITPRAVPSLRALVIGGEALTQDLCQIWGSEGSERPVVFNAYGPSEATIGNSVARISKRSQPSNIGAPFPGTQYLVLKEVDGRLTPTPRGGPGELYIGGDQVAKGYLNRSGPSPFIQYQGQMVYRTGDMVRLHPSDEAEYLGRIDGSQVKVRGARLELGEVDAAIAAALKEHLKEIGNAVTIHVEHPKIAGPARLVSFFARRSARTGHEDGPAPSELLLQASEAIAQAKELRKRVRDRLPQYMVPSIVLPLTYLPISSLSGKADRRLLKDLYHSIDPRHFANSNGPGDEEKRDLTSSEQTVARIVRASVRINSDIDLTHDLDLITAGLDSLSVVTLAGKLRKHGYNASVSSIMNEPTIEAITRQRSNKDAVPQDADQVDWDHNVQRLTAKAKALPQYRQAEIEMVLPCVPMQVAFVSQAISEERNTPRYISTITIDVTRTDFSADQIRDAWMATLARHAIYRTVFTEIDHALVQVVLSPKSLAASWSASSEVLPAAQELGTYHGRTARDVAAHIRTVPALRLKLWRRKEAAPTLTLTCSHAIYDGASIRMLLQEVSDRLGGEYKGAPALPFADATRLIVGDAKERAAKKFWSDVLAGFSLTQVPNLTGIRPENNISHSEELAIATSQSFAQLEAAARANKVTVQSILVAAFARLLGLYVGDDDVTLGLVLSGRSIPVNGIQSIHGPCVTTVPLRLTEVRSAAMIELCRRTHQTVNTLLPYQHVSLPQLMRWLHLSRPPFEVLFSYLGRTGTTAERSLFVEKDTQMEKDYPLALEISATNDTVNIRLAFDTRLIPAGQAKLILAQLDDVLAAFSGSPVAQASGEKHLSILNKDCYVPSSPSEAIVARFSEHARRSPDAPAIAFTSSMRETPKLTSYAELDLLSTNIAQHLVDKPGQFVGVHLDKEGPELYAAILAIWKAGKAYLPLDPSLPAERLSYMIGSIGDCTVITNRNADVGLINLRGEVLALVDLVAARPRSPQLPPPSLDAPCYLLFTSGSTGTPKAVQISHRALAGALYSWERMLPFTTQSRFLQLASIGFDVSLIELCMPLSLGFSIGTAPKQELLEDLTHSIQHLGVTIADLPAALAGAVHPEDVQLEWLMSGGDVIDSRVVDEWNRADRLLINAWGPTEATIGNTLGRVKAGATRNAIGRVYPTSSMYVLEEGSTQTLPLGAIGELVVGGPQLADCYYGRDDLTAEKFIHLQDGSRAYRTGDLGRFLHDGTVECLGRIGSDRQVKVNGQRMELDEVSSVLSAQPGVQEADVQYLKHPSMGAKQLVAFVAAIDARKNTGEVQVRDDDDALELSIRLEQEAAKRLATYMVPTHWIVTKQGLPLTHNNKTDHKALAAFYERLQPSLLRFLGAKREGAVASKAWTEIEQKLREIVAEFCDVPEDQIARNTSFHRLGIDSISAIRFVKELRALGFVFTVADVLSTPNISALAEKSLRSSNPTAAAQTGGAAVLRDWVEHTSTIAENDGWALSSQDSLVSILPCTPLQSGMIAQSLASAGSMYFHHHAFQLTDVTSEQVSGAWKRLVERLDILRTTFHQVEGAHPWAEAVHSVTAPRVVHHSGSFSGQNLHRIDGQPSFEDEDVFRTPPHVLHLWSERGQGNGLVILLSIHHALYDGTSLPQLLKDFEALIDANEQQLTARLPFYKVVPSILSQDGDVRHWTEALHGFVPIPLTARSTGRAGAATLVEKQLALTSQELESRCRSIGVSMQVLCNLAFGKLLALESNNRDICFGQLFGLLDLVPEADSAVGPAFNTVATRIRFAGLEDSVRKVAAALQSANDAGRPHRRAALRDVQAKIHRGQLFDALFDYQRAYDDADGGKLQALGLPDSGEEKPQYTLNVAFVQSPSKLSVIAKADSSRYSQDALAALVGRLEDLLHHLSSHADEPVSALPETFAGTAFPEHLPEISSTARDSSFTSGDSAARSEAPLGEEGRQLASIISKVAGVAESELHGDTRLTLLGLDSIAAIRIASQARKSGINLRMGEIVSGTTINGILAGRAQANGVKANGHAHRNSHVNGNGHVYSVPAESPVSAQQVAAQVGVEADRIEHVLPILAGQKLWLATWAQSNNRGEGGFSFAYRLRGMTSLRAQETWSNLRQLHPILRTVFFLSQDGSAAQVVLKPESRSDLSHFTEIEAEAEEAENAAEEVVARRAAEGWHDLSKPPVQLTLVGDILVFSLHHILYDAFSIEMLVRDFAALYHGGAAVSSTAWVEAVKYVSDEQQQIRADAEQYWARSLSGAQSGLLPAASVASPMGEAFYAERKAISTPWDLDAKMRKANVTLPAIVLAAWSTLLTERLGDRAASPVFGLYQLGRSTSFDSIETVQGPLLNVLPMQVKGGSILDRAQGAAQQLKSRGRYEQTDLVDAHRWAGLSTDKPSYNTFVNLLIASTNVNDAAQDKYDLQPVDLGHPLSYAVKDAQAQDSTTKLPKKAKAVPAHAAIWQPDVNVDIVLGGPDGVDVAMKANTGVIAEAELPSVVRRLAELIVKTIAQL